MTILPTGDCFSDALTFIGRLVAKDPELLWGPSEYRLVHAICTSEAQPELGTFAHAWVESKEGCTFAGIVEEGEFKGETVWITAERESFYDDLQPREVVEYTILSAAQQNQSTGHLGPWHPVIKRFTRQAIEEERQQ